MVPAVVTEQANADVDVARVTGEEICTQRSNAPAATTYEIAAPFIDAESGNDESPSRQSVVAELRTSRAEVETMLARKSGCSTRKAGRRGYAKMVDVDEQCMMTGGESTAEKMRETEG